VYDDPRVVTKAPGRFEAMADTCIANHEEILRYGSVEMQTASRMLLYALAVEIRRRESDAEGTADSEVSARVLANSQTGMPHCWPTLFR
jgi:hypothetical protein